MKLQITKNIEINGEREEQQCYISVEAVDGFVYLDIEDTRYFIPIGVFTGILK